MNRKEYLNIDLSSARYRQSHWALYRHPLIYEDSTELDINYARLPKPEEMATMELASHGHAVSPFLFFEKGTKTGLAQMFVLLGAVLWVVMNVVPPGGILMYGMGIAVVVSFVLYSTKTASIGTIKNLLAAPLALEMFNLAVHFLNLNRFIIGIFLIIVNLYLLKRYVAPPFQFYREWLASHPWLTNAQRREMMERDTDLNPSIGLLLFIFIFGLIAVSFSVTLAILVVYAVVLIKIFIDSGSPSWTREVILELIKFVDKPLRKYLSYEETVAPGIWMPSDLMKSRRGKVLLTCLLFYLAFNIIFCMMGPWDLSRLSSDVNLTWEDTISISIIPYMWLLEIGNAMSANEGSAFIFLLILAPLIHVSLPLLSFLAIFQKPVQNLLALEREVMALKEQDTRSEWKWYVDRLRNSMHEAVDPLGIKVREAEHMFMGVEKHAKYPILLDEKILSEHTYIAGETGSGKTSMGIMPILLQLIEGHTQKDGSTSPVPPIVILDLKGDSALFHSVRNAALQRAVQDAISRGVDPNDSEALEAAKRDAFRFFTPEKGRPSHIFNPFDNLKSESRSLMQLCNILLDSLSLNHGEGYGRSYYSLQSRLTLAKALTLNPDPKSFKDLSETVIKLSKKENIRDIFELLAVVHALSHYPQLGSAQNAPADEVIKMSEVIDKGQVVYFWLPSALESVSVREIGKLAFYTFFTALVDRQRSGVDQGNARQCYLVIDEFQRLAGQNFKIILEQARSFGLGAILANQSMGDLKTTDGDLKPTIRTNTRLKMFFSLSDPVDVKDVTENSGQEIALMTANSQMGDSEIQTIKNRISINDVLEMSDSPLEMFFQVSRGSGYAQFGGMPIMARITWPLLFEEYKALATQPWPETSITLDQESPVEKDRKAQEEIKDLLERLVGDVDSLFPDL